MKNIQVLQGKIRIDGYYLNIIEDDIYLIGNHDLYYKIYKSIERDGYNMYFSKKGEENPLKNDEHFLHGYFWCLGVHFF